MFNKVWTETNSGQVWQRICCMKKQRLSFLSPHSLKGHFCAPIWQSCHDYWVCGLKSNMTSKLIKHRKKREPDKSDRKLTACLIQALSAWNSLSQACLVMLSFWDTQLPSRRAWKKKTTIRKIKYLKELEDKFLFEH